LADFESVVKRRTRTSLKVIFRPELLPRIELKRLTDRDVVRIDLRPTRIGVKYGLGALRIHTTMKRLLRGVPERGRPGSLQKRRYRLWTENGERG